MKTKRLIIETTPSSSEALSKVLQSQGKTLTDWFSEKVEEEAVNYFPGKQADLFTSFQVKSLGDLESSKDVLKIIASEEWDFADADTGYLSHGIHPYPAKYIPQLPNKLIQMLSMPGEVVWDQFGGSGTTALEALLLNRSAFSSDINPIAAIIGKAKTTALVPTDLHNLELFSKHFYLLSADSNSLLHTINIHKEASKIYIPNIPNLLKWFDQQTVDELAYIKWSIHNKLEGNCEVLALAVFSKIITRLSFQDGETRYVSKPRTVESGETVAAFRAELDSTTKKVKQLPPTLIYNRAEFLTENSSVATHISDDSIDLIVTSPPYPNATDYHLYHRFRIFWLGFDPKSMAQVEIGSHLRHQRDESQIEQYVDEMKGAMQSAFRCLRRGRYAIYVVGNAVFKGEEMHTAGLLAKAAKKVGFEVVGIVERNLPENKRSFSSPARRLKSEDILILRKPKNGKGVKLYKPPYKLWPYEEILRRKEIAAIVKAPKTEYGSEYDLLVSDKLNSDQIRKLTFTHFFEEEGSVKQKTWQSVLENGDATDKQCRKEPKYVTHGIHPYKGKFYPQLAKSLMNLSDLAIGNTILDPFCGSGTVLLESYLNGYNSVGLDINPLALKIARVKTNILNQSPLVFNELVDSFLASISNEADIVDFRTVFESDSIPELESWFAEKVLGKLASIYCRLNEIPNVAVADFIEVCLSSIVRDISQQDPQDLRIRRRKEPLSDAPVYETLRSKITQQQARINNFFTRVQKAPWQFGTSHVIEADCRDIKSFKKANAIFPKIDAVITSPPYATALPYIDTDRLSILLLFNKLSPERSSIEKQLIGAREITTSERKLIESSINSSAFATINSETAIHTIAEIHKLNTESEVGFRKKNLAALLYRYYQDMSSVISNINETIKKDGNIFFVIGDNKTTAGTEKQLSIKSGKILEEMGKCIGWNLVEVIPITVTQENRLHNKNGITENEIIWFRK